jgi:hypothetical protein
LATHERRPVLIKTFKLRRNYKCRLFNTAKAAFDPQGRELTPDVSAGIPRLPGLRIEFSRCIPKERVQFIVVSAPNASRYSASLPRHTSHLGYRSPNIWNELDNQKR